MELFVGGGKTIGHGSPPVDAGKRARCRLEAAYMRDIAGYDNAASTALRTTSRSLNGQAGVRSGRSMHHDLGDWPWYLFPSGDLPERWWERANISDGLRELVETARDAQASSPFFLEFDAASLIADEAVIVRRVHEEQ